MGFFHALGQAYFGLRGQSEAATPLWLAHFFSREAAKMRRKYEGVGIQNSTFLARYSTFNRPQNPP